MEEESNDNIQKNILEEHRLKQNIKVSEFSLDASQFLLSNGKAVKLKDTGCPYKKVIFKALHYVNYLINFTDELPVTTDFHFPTHAVNFIGFCNEYELNKNENNNLLKEFEVFRVDSGIKPQSSGVKMLRGSFRTVLVSEMFTAKLTSSELDFLTLLSETKLAPDAITEQCTLTSWFSQHTWLRREDVGVGADLYARFTSPKALMKSFNITTEISLLELQKSKYELIAFFEQNKEDLMGFRTIPVKEKTKLSSDYRCEKERIIRANMNLLRVVYHKMPEQPEALKNSISLLIKSFSLGLAKNSTESDFFANKMLTSQTTIVNKVVNQFITKDGLLFPLDYVYDLVQYSRNKTKGRCPTSTAEHTLFQWLMASLCVQSSDIPKLRLCDFNILRKNNGSVVSIESEYFKGRGQDYQVTEGVRGNTKKGQAILNFIADATSIFNDKYRYITLSYTLNKSTNCSQKSRHSTFFADLADSHIYQCIKNEHFKNKVSNIILNSLNKLSQFGVSYDETRKKNLKNIETPLSISLFQFTHIKNSAVHAKSDSFDPTRLLNYQSHSNETERCFYLTPENEEWQNNCGLITRAIMQDIYSNVYRFSDMEAHTFNSEFMNARESIEQRKNDTLARLKLVTGKGNGEIVDELGIRKVQTLKVENVLFDTIYIIDSGETVMKLKHYVFEAETHCKALLESSPTYLFNTVLPTVEWIESLFAEVKFSRASLENGKNLFNKYVDILPPIFQPYGAT